VSFGWLERDANRFVDGQLLLARKPRAERLPVHERHHIEEQTVRFTAVEQRQNVRVLQVCRDADCAQEPLDAEHRAELGAEDLERDRAVVLRVARQEHGGHAALPDLALDTVAIGERSGQARERISHAGRSVSCFAGFGEYQ